LVFFELHGVPFQVSLRGRCFPAQSNPLVLGDYFASLVMTLVIYKEIASVAKNAPSQ
jgi:hypothetical protein